MSIPTSINSFGNYVGIIEGMLATGADFVAETESDSTVQVERGMILADAAVGRNVAWDTHTRRLVELAASERFADIAVVDLTGQKRSIYRPLLVYAWAAAMGAPTDPTALKKWRMVLEARLSAWAALGRPTLAADGQLVAEVMWCALALHAAGRRTDERATLLAAQTIGVLTQSQLPSGAFLQASTSDNLETNWYHELVILHAAASFAAGTGDARLADAVMRNAEFHQNETQPDHATSHPWGLLAFIWNPATRPLADQILHNVRTLHPAGVSGISRILLADTLLGLRRLD